MTKDEALKLALKALRFARDDGYENEVSQEAITAIKQARSAPVQEPVAWVCYRAPGKRGIDFEESDINGLPIGTLLYTTPPAQPAPVPLTDEQAHQILLDMAKHIETFGPEDITEQQLSAECVRFICQRVAAHGITKGQPILEQALAAQPAPVQEELQDLKRSEREGWRYADELEQERKRLTAQRTWVGLTGEDFDFLVPYCGNDFDLQDYKDFARAIEAKLKEKNT